MVSPARCVGQGRTSPRRGPDDRAIGLSPAGRPWLNGVSDGARAPARWRSATGPDPVMPDRVSSAAAHWLAVQLAMVKCSVPQVDVMDSLFASPL